MFPQDGESVPNVRFDGFTGDWQSVQLGDVVEKLKSYSLSRDVETNDMTGYRYIHYGDIHKQVADVITDDAQLPQIKVGDYIYLKRGDLVLADASEDYVGIAEPCVILHEPQEHIVAGLHTIAIRPINTDSLFLYHLFHTDGFRKFGGFVGTGLKVFGITFSNLSKYEMKLPSLAEQVSIGGFFYNLDTQITSIVIKLEQLKQLKSAYLQKMFI
jgi:type I restriction enzyme S subunit